MVHNNKKTICQYATQKIYIFRVFREFNILRFHFIFIFNTWIYVKVYACYLIRVYTYVLILCLLSTAKALTIIWLVVEAVRIHRIKQRFFLHTHIILYMWDIYAKIKIVCGLIKQ